MTFDEFAYALAKLDNTVIHHPAHSRAILRVQTAVAMSSVANLNGAVVVMGLSGIGKTVVLNQFKKSFEAQKPESPYRCVMIEMPNNVTYRSLGIQLLSQINCPVRISKATTEAMITELVAHQYASAGVECMIFDETQRLINRNNSLNLENVANALTSIMNLVKKPLIIAGTPEIDQLRKGFGPLARRVQDTIKLQPFDTRSSGGIADFTKLIGAINATLPLKLPAWILSDEGLEFIQLQTGGIIGVLLPLIRHAARDAFMLKEDAISAQRLIDSAAELELSEWQQVGQANSSLIRVSNLFQPKRSKP